MKVLIVIALSLLVLVQYGTAANDHLVTMLQTMHHSHVYQKLHSDDKVTLVELVAAAEADTVTHYIDTMGIGRLLHFLDQVTRIDQQEAHRLEVYLEQELSQELNPTAQPSSIWTTVGTLSPNANITKRDNLQTILAAIQKNQAYQNLTQVDKDLVQELITAAEHGYLTGTVYREGYARIIALIEHISTPTETHSFITYLVGHLNMEAQQHTPSPVGK